MAANANNIITGVGVVTIDATDVGYTEGGIQVRHTSDFLDVIADQAIGVVKKFRTLERMFLKFTMMEVTLANIRAATMQPSSNLSGSTLTLGYNDACWVDELAIVIVGSGPSCGTRTWTFPKCVVTGERSIEMKRDAAQMLELELEILKDASGVFGDVEDS